MEISKLDQPVYKILKKASSIAKEYFENFKSLNVQNKKDFSPVEGFLVKATPVEQSLPILPNTIA